MMRVIFVGSQNLGCGGLRVFLQQGHEICRVYAPRPDPHEIEWYEPIHVLSRENDLDTVLDPSLNQPDTIREIEGLAPDLICVFGWRRLISPNVLAIPPKGTLAIHFSLLPQGRGFAPVNWAILNGLKETGATLFYLDEGMDTGDIIAQTRVPIAKIDTAMTLSNKLTDASLSMLSDMLPRIVDGTNPRKPQDHRQATYYAKRIPEDGIIDWQQTAQAIYDQVRALTCPYPGAFTYFENHKLFIWEATLPEEDQHWSGRPGQIIRMEHSGPAWILTGHGLLRLEIVQIDGKDRMPAGDVLRSLKIRLGS